MSNLSIISWNMYQAPQMWGRAKRYKALLTRLIELVDEKDPDVICLQEVHIYKLGRLGKFLHRRGFPNYKGFASNLINFSTELAMMLENRWTSQPSHDINDDNVRKIKLLLSTRGYFCIYSPIEKGEYMNNGLATFVRHPIQYPTFSMNFHSDSILQPGILFHQINIENKKVWIINTHLLATMNVKYILHRFVEYYRRLTHLNTFETIIDSYMTLTQLTKNIIRHPQPHYLFLVGDFNANHGSKLHTLFNQMILCENLYRKSQPLSTALQFTQADQEHIDYIYMCKKETDLVIHEFTVGEIDLRLSDHAFLFCKVTI